MRSDINGTSLRKSTYLRLATGSEPATYSWTFSAARLAAGAIHAYSGVDPTSPIDASGGALGRALDRGVAPSITTSVPNTLLVGFFANQTNATWTPPAGMTERGERIGTGRLQDHLDSRAPTRPPRAPVATGSRTATASKAAASVAHLVALRPASGGPPPLNQEPTFDQDLGDRTDAEGTVVNLDAGATDLDGDPLTYAATQPAAGPDDLDHDRAHHRHHQLGRCGRQPLRRRSRSATEPRSMLRTRSPGRSRTCRRRPTASRPSTRTSAIAPIPRAPCVNLDAGATDLDGDALTYAATNLPAGLSISTTTGLITGTISSTAAAGSPYSRERHRPRRAPRVDATDTFSWTVTDVAPRRASPCAR